MKHITSRGRFIAAGLVAAGAAALVTGVGVTTASATTSSDTATIESFRETVKPWDSISIPSLSCPSGSWLIDQDLSLGRGVPRGVEVTGDSGWIGTTITAMDHEYVTVDGVGGTKLQYRPITGTTNERGVSTATNWDAFSSHELVVNLHCTTDIFKASQSAR
jgi:hypothetical protein